MNDFVSLLILGGILVAGIALLDRFAKSKEGNDERGKLIQYQVQSFLFQYTICGIGLLLALDIGGFLTADQFRYGIQFLLLSCFLVGALYLYWRKRRG